MYKLINIGNNNYRGRKMNNREVGSYGEEVASDFLLAHGYEILEKNFWTRHGEIDLIGCEAGVLAFIEVKLARKGTSIAPQEQITQGKKQHLQRVAKYYLLEKGVTSSCRFDLVAISGLEEENRQIELIKNAFLVTS